MDPNACMKRVLYWLWTGQHAECKDACIDLLGWLEKGGFAPTECGTASVTKADLKTFLIVLTKICDPYPD